MRIAFVSYETPFAPAGGVAAVMGKLPTAMSGLGAGDVTVVTPFHHKIKKTADLAPTLTVAAELDVRFQSRKIHVRVMRGTSGYLFLQADDADFFAGSPHPYRVTDSKLRRDALFFGVAAWQALERVDGKTPWVLMLQDWEAATTALAASRATRRPRMVLTLHNSYDTAVTDDQLADFDISPAACPGQTVLTRALRFMERKVPTVSGQFALDLLSDPLQSKVLADQLAAPLSGRLIGVNNGPFADLEMPPHVLASAVREDFAPLADWKSDNRSRALKALRGFAPSSERPFWGNRDQMLETASNSLPWFVMAGRDDPRQKGYDVAAEAVRSFLKAGGLACFFFFPMPGDEGLAGLSFLKSLAEECPSFVSVFPFRWEEGFSATLRGASFGLMPSFYEPFGMANEFYLNGTLGIGRATGGIAQQIVPLRGCASFSLAAEAIANRWHASSARPTGLLYSEALEAGEAIEGWKRINDAAYERGEHSTQRVESRRSLPLFQSMVTELFVALRDGCRVSRDPGLYGQMLVEGVRYIEKGFSWQRAAREYGRVARLSSPNWTGLPEVPCKPE